MYDFRVDNGKKAFIVVVSGFNKDGTSNFVEMLKSEVAKINPSEFTLVLDGQDMKTFKPVMLPALEKSYELYMSFGFKEIVVINPTRVTPRLQIKRIAKNCNFTGSFISGEQEALKVVSTIS